MSINGGAMNKQWILVTGGKGEIGEGIIRALNENGYSTIDLSRSTEEDTEKNGNWYFQCDITDENQLKKSAEKLGEKEIVLSGLVHNAGVPGNSVGLPFTNIDIEDFDLCFNVHNKGFFLLLKHFLPFFSPDGASVVAMSSIAAVKNGESILPYAASKAALNTMIECFARELAPKKIRVNGVAPGFVWSPLWEKLAHNYMKNMNTEMTPENFFEKVVEKRTLFHKPQTAREIAEQVWFLISPQSSAMTGKILYADGGASIL
jgi:NAD(P)-dependent dehydrogenase (short-subunit alcohol dehydrogenase family)